MNESDDHIGLLDEMVTSAIDAGVVHHTAEDEQLHGRTIQLEGRSLVNFSSCSYLGLELDPRIIEGVVEGVRRYGSQFCSSRVYVSAPAYIELEERLTHVFGAETIVAPSTTLGHLSALPVLVSPRDAVLLDHHVHNSVQMAATLLRSAGSHVELVRHHDLAQLEERVCDLTKTHERVWYLVDGVCSMFGDLAPMADFRALLERHEAMRLYVDDAHGMSWCGPNGRGYALSEAPLHHQMVVTTSLCKAFGAGGGAIVLPDKETRRRVRTCGATLLFSGPMQPPMLGAALASARIHMSPEIDALQARHLELSRVCKRALDDAGLVVPSDPRAPVQFVEVGLPHEAQRVVRGMMDDGHFANVAQFPAVPVKRSGVRFTLTLHHGARDIEEMVDSLARHLALLDRERGAPASKGEGARIQPPVASAEPRPRAMRVECADSIDELDAREWDRLLGDRGNYTASGLSFLEACFRNAPELEQRWSFRYYRVIGPEGEIHAATFCTAGLWKADMLAPPEVSAEVERMRESDPHHLTHRVFAMGCLLTEGNHLYLDPELGEPGDPDTLPVLDRLLAEIQKDALAYDCGTVVLRDLETPSASFEQYLRDQGFIAMKAPDSFELDVDWKDHDDFLNGLSYNSRRHQRKSVEPFDDHYLMTPFSKHGETATTLDLRRIEALYTNVKRQSLALNTFDLPSRFFSAAANSEDWEILSLSSVDPDAPSGPLGIVVSYTGDDHYVPLVIGLDYDYVRCEGLYRQCLRHVIERARDLGRRRVHLGMGAPLEKSRFGARSTPRFLFVQASDHYVFDVIEQLSHQIPERATS